MTLGELIAQLETLPADAIVKRGFTKPHSYRGYYKCLAFEPANDVTVASMLAACHEADGAVYEGWKGGDFGMDRGTTVFLATEGRTGYALFGLGAIVNDVTHPDFGVIAFAFEEPWTW